MFGSDHMQWFNFRILYVYLSSKFNLNFISFRIEDLVFCIYIVFIYIFSLNKKKKKKFQWYDHHLGIKFTVFFLLDQSNILIILSNFLYNLHVDLVSYNYYFISFFFF